MTDPACAAWRRRIADQVLDRGPERCEAIADHLRRCPACTHYQMGLTGPAQSLDRLFAPAPPPARAWRRLRRAAVGPRRGLGPWPAIGAAALGAALWLGLGTASQAAARADESTLVAAVWASRPAVAAYQAAGITNGVWPSAPHGAGLVCRLRDGRWLVSVLVHDLPAGAVLREQVATGGGRLVRLLRPVGHTVLDVAAVPASDGPVRRVTLSVSEPGQSDGGHLLAWRVAVAPTPASERVTPVAQTPVWNG